MACGLIIDELAPAEAVSQGRIHVENEVLSAESFAIEGCPGSLSGALSQASELDEFRRKYDAVCQSYDDNVAKRNHLRATLADAKRQMDDMQTTCGE